MKKNIPKWLLRHIGRKTWLIMASSTRPSVVSKSPISWGFFFHWVEPLLQPIMLKNTKLHFFQSIDNRDMASPPTTPVSPKEYDIEIATIDDKEDILDFLREFFFRDEPLNKFLDLINAQSPRCLDLEYFSTKEINNGLNLKAVHNGKIIGVCLNGILKRGYLNEPEDGQKITDPKFSKIVRLLDRVAAESNIFAKFPNCDSAMTVKIITVNDAYRGQGIAKELLKKTRAIAKQKGCELMTVECSSHFTALAVKKLGFECVYRLPYAEHKENGKVVFKPEPPHDAVTVYVSKLNESCSF